MRAPALTATAVLALAGCTPPGAADPAGERPAVRHMVIDQLPQRPAHDDHDTVVLPDVADPGDPAGVAIERIATGLTGQGLELVDVGADELRSRTDRSTIRVIATHRSEAGGSHTSIFDVDLIRWGVRWAVTSARTVP